jgi:hypothetical protein
VASRCAASVVAERLPQASSLQASELGGQVPDHSDTTESNVAALAHVSTRSVPVQVAR